MQTLKELKQTYDNSHSDYEHLLSRADITDKKLNKIKKGDLIKRLISNHQSEVLNLPI